MFTVLYYGNQLAKLHVHLTVLRNKLNKAENINFPYTQLHVSLYIYSHMLLSWLFCIVYFFDLDCVCYHDIVRELLYVYYCLLQVWIKQEKYFILKHKLRTFT